MHKNLTPVILQDNFNIQINEEEHQIVAEIVVQ